MRELQVQAIGVSPGIVIGELRGFSRKRLTVRPRPLKESEVEAEIKRHDAAIEKARKGIQRVSARVRRRLGADSANIFEAHLLMLDDPMLTERSREIIRQDLVNADFAVLTAMSEIQKAFSSVKDEFFRQRLSDLEDVGRRLIENIQSGRPKSRKVQPEGRHILIADDLSPSEAACLDMSTVIGLVTEKGSQTSHTAILCRSLGVPAIVGVEGLFDKLKEGETCILDGNTGLLVVEPESATMLEYSSRRRAFSAFMEKLEPLRNEQAITEDGHRIELSSNIELPMELEHVERIGGDGIGLFRTEYLFLAAETMPDEDVQFREYRRAAKAVSPKRLIIRTFDLGGDKQPGGMVFPRETNPFLGWRAIRVSLDRPRMFKTQLRAILRASLDNNVQLMFPMISGMTELEQALDQLDQVKQELREEKIEFNEKIKVGIMIEVPSAVIMSDRLAERVDFFSIGTNDLTMYTLAVDRNNNAVSNRYQSLHPAVLRSIAQTVEAGQKAGKWVGLCGELASDPAATMLLLGMGLDELSVSPVMLPEIKLLIRSLKISECRAFATKILALCNAEEIERKCDRALKKHFGDLPLWRPASSTTRK